jgi:hypothetical protein
MEEAVIAEAVIPEEVVIAVEVTQAVVVLVAAVIAEEEAGDINQILKRCFNL